jgi:hypothetical protein
LPPAPPIGILAKMAWHQYRAGRKHRMPKANEIPSNEELDAKIAQVELQARFFEAQIRVLEARKRLAELRRSMKSATST